MRTPIDAYKIIVWHNNAVEGTHQRVLCSGKTLKGVTSEFNRYIQRPARYRSFNQHNKIQLVLPDDTRMDIVVTDWE